jgi:AcrR family transcriptional regulator
LTPDPPTPRQARREAKTAALLEHAAALVVEGGMDALTMPRLASRAGVAVGGLYRYFDGKDALIAALQLQAIGRLASFLDTRSVRDGSEGVVDLVLGVAAFQRAHPTPFLLLDLAVSDPRQLLDDAHAAEVSLAVQPILQRVEAHLAAAVDAGELAPGDARQRTRILWGTTFGLLHLRKQDARQTDATHTHDVLLTEALATLLRGWRLR